MMTDERTSEASPWGPSLQVALCKVCDWKFLLPLIQKECKCPHCFSSDLVQISDGDVVVQPELYLPFEVTETGLTQSIQRFSSGLWFPPVDLTFANLYKRLHRVFLPVWLIDSQVVAQWQAEAGFNYQVMSHQDRYTEADGGWSSHEITETRVRWEPRLGRLKRTYQNIAVPALEQHALLMGQLGEYSFDHALTYDSKKVLDIDSTQKVFVRLNDRTEKDAWPEALPRFQSLAAKNCQEACSADDIRDFTWIPEFQNQNWTLLLLPALTTYYLDDQNNRQALLINGQTGRLYGTRRASIRRARYFALWMAGIALVIFVISLIGAVSSALLPGLLILAMIGWGLAILLGVSAILPLALVWWTNRNPNS